MTERVHLVYEEYYYWHCLLPIFNLKEKQDAELR